MKEYTFEDLQNKGVLWAINRVLFHPRGLALAYNPDNEKFSVLGDGTEPWSFTEKTDDEKFNEFKNFLRGLDVTYDS